MSIKNKKYILSLIAVAAVIIIYLIFQDKIDAILNDGQNNESGYTATVDNQAQSGNSNGSNSSQNSGTSTASDSSDNGSVSDSQSDATVTTQESDPTDAPAADYVTYKFRSKKLLDQHYEKHGKEMGFKSAADYEKAASDVVNNPDALNKIEKEDGDYVYYVEDTNEFVIVSTDGYIRTYFLPSAGKSYYDRQ